MKKIIYLFLILFTIACSLETKSKHIQNNIEISWTNELAEDFSFAQKWSYPEGIYLNQHNQLSCDGICPPEIDRMKDENGKIFEDSLTAFYQLVDTTRIYHSILSETNMPEVGNTDFVSAIKIGNDTIHCFTLNNASTHSSLNLYLTDNKVTPFVILNSINLDANKKFECAGGTIEIDKPMFEKGILKAKFDFQFTDIENNNKTIYWKGKIYKIIE